MKNGLITLEDVREGDIFQMKIVWMQDGKIQHHTGQLKVKKVHRGIYKNIATIEFQEFEKHPLITHYVITNEGTYRMGSNLVVGGNNFPVYSRPLEIALREGHIDTLIFTLIDGFARHKHDISDAQNNTTSN